MTCFVHFLRVVAVCRPRAQSARDNHVLACDFAKYSPIFIFFTHRLSNKPFLIWLLTIPPHLKCVATLPCNLSLVVRALTESNVMVHVVHRELFPDSRCLFMYRDFIPTAKSVYRISMVQPSLRFVYLLGQLSGHLNRKMFNSLGFDAGDTPAVRLDNSFTAGVALSAAIINAYLDMRRGGLDIRAVRYEDLVARPLDMCRAILELCHLPASLAELAVKALEEDAHKNSRIAKSVVGGFKEPQLTPDTKAQLNDVLKQFKMPLIGEQIIVDGLLTCS